MSEKIKCAMLQGTFFMFFCLAFSFNTYYLGTAGFSDRATGILISVSCLAGGLLQAAAGRMADRNPVFIWKNQVIVLAIAETVLSAALYFTGKGLAAGIIFGCMMALSLPMVPMINMATFYYSEHGVPVDYGMARGTGSMSFAVMSYIAGKATVMWGSRMVTVLAVISAVAILATALSMPMYKTSTDDAEKKREAALAGQMSASERMDHRHGILRKYPVFTAMIMGIFLLMFMHNVVCTYMIRIVEAVGGNSGSMGTAMAIAAATELPMMFVYGRMVKRFKLSDAAFITIAGLFYIFRGVLFVMAGSVGMIFFIQAFQGMSYGLLAVSRSNYANKCMDAEDQSTGQSLAAMTESIGALTGSLAGGLLIASAGVRVMLMAAAAAAAAGTLITFICGRHKSAKGSEGQVA